MSSTERKRQIAPGYKESLYDPTIGLRDFSKDPIRKVPNRLNRVRVAGNLRVSSDCYAWLKTLPPTEPRNASLTFYPIDPENEDFEKLTKLQGEAAAALARLGLFEGGAGGGKSDATADAVAPKPAEPKKRRRGSQERVRRPERRASPPVARQSRSDPLTRARRGNAIRRAYRDYLTGRAVWRRGSFAVRHVRSGRLTPAPWNDVVLEQFSTPEEFFHAAFDWNRARRENGLSTFGPEPP